MEDMFLQLINLSLAVGMVILLAALVRPLLVRRYRRALLRGIWAVLAVRLLLPVSLPAAAVEMELPASLGQPVAARVAAPLPGGESESIQSGGQELPAASEEKAATVPADLPAASPLELAALVWLTGAAALALVSIGRHLAWKRRVLALAQPVSDTRQQVFLRACRACGVRPPRLLGSPTVNTPLAFGLVRPMVLLPEGEWTDGELYAVFCHELCHIRRGDLWLQGVIRLACWAHWFNPAVWLLARLAGEDMELACDERVLRLADAPAGRDYGLALLETACRIRPAGHTSCFSSAGRSLSRRLGAIVVQVKKRPGRPLLVLALAAALGCTGLAACTVATEPQQPGSQSAPDSSGLSAVAASSAQSQAQAGADLPVCDTLEPQEMPVWQQQNPADGQVRTMELPQQTFLPWQTCYCADTDEVLAIAMEKGAVTAWYGQPQTGKNGVDRHQWQAVSLELDQIPTGLDVRGVYLDQDTWTMTAQQPDQQGVLLHVWQFDRDEDGRPAGQVLHHFVTRLEEEYTLWNAAFSGQTGMISGTVQREGENVPVLLRTQDGGEYWQSLDLAPVLADCPADSLQGEWVMAQGDIWELRCLPDASSGAILSLLSTDGGESWMWYPRQPGSTTRQLLEQAPELQSAEAREQIYQQMLQTQGALPQKG